MLLTKYIAENCIVSELASITKADAIKELTHLLFEKKKLQDVGTALDQVMARETVDSTGIGNGIAVPHARVSGLKSLMCAVGRHKAGIDFMSVDKKPVHLIFLVCYPPTQQTTYLNFVATIAKLLRSEENVKAMLRAPAEKDMFAVLEQISESFVSPEESYGKQMKTAPDLLKTKDAHADLILLARLQLCQEMYDTAKSGKKQLKQRIDNIRGLIEPRLLKHYDRLMKARPPALVPIEGDTCQGCFMKLPSQFAQKVRQDTEHIHTCNNCSRFIYVL
ncbi:MAG TPA: PTS sugar transporter subunit IIA [Candidatus Hydrogenedentes bacterium]|nr:PTS sugar transporter subunit IIA [Candidatus Hydrogenedentota bacterium]